MPAKTAPEQVLCDLPWMEMMEAAVEVVSLACRLVIAVFSLLQKLPMVSS